MSRIVNILAYTIAIMLRHWRSTMSLIVVYAFVVFAFASVLFFVQALTYETKIVLRSTPDVWVQKIVGGRLVPIKKDAVTTIARMRGVGSVQERLWGYYFDSITGGVFTIIGTDSIPLGVNVVVGRPLRELDTSGVAVCGTGYLETHRASVGSNIVLFDPNQNLRTLRVVGAFQSPSDLLTRDLIIVSRREARQLLGIGKEYSTDLVVNVPNPSEINTISGKISRKLRSVRVVTRSDLQSTYEALFGYRGSLFLFGLSMSLLAFLILAWHKAGGLSLAERKEIGIQKAVGWGINDVLLQKFWEGAVISINATLLGLIGAYVHVFFLDAPLLKPYLVGWSVIYPSFHLLPHVEAGSIVLVFVLSVVPYLAATIVPSWKSAISDPSEAMHGT
jgi:hypothetical protein